MQTGLHYASHSITRPGRRPYWVLEQMNPARVSRSGAGSAPPPCHLRVTSAMLSESDPTAVTGRPAPFSAARADGRPRARGQFRTTRRSRVSAGRVSETAALGRPFWRRSCGGACQVLLPSERPARRPARANARRPPRDGARKSRPDPGPRLPRSGYKH